MVIMAAKQGIRVKMEEGFCLIVVGNTSSNQSFGHFLIVVHVVTSQPTPAQVGLTKYFTVRKGRSLMMIYSSNVFIN